MATGQKHLVKCRCFLPQFKDLPNPINHHFVVFSIVDENDQIIPKFVKCNNCSIVHKVFDFTKSEIVNGREDLNSLVEIDDIKIFLSEKISQILEKHKCDLATWEQVQFIVENKQWGQFVVLTYDTDQEITQGKCLIILGENLFKIENFVRNEVF